MKSFKELEFKEHYDSQKDNLIKDFYIPALANTKRYRRVVGFFNSKSLASVAVGLKDFIINKGKMDLLCGVDLNPEDVNIVKFASEHPEEFLSSNFLKELNSIEDEIVKHHVEVLGWMIANKLLRIKIAVKVDSMGNLVPKGEGILHYKIGLMYDCNNNLISFSGSVNETEAAWKKNLEEFHLFRDWKEGEIFHLKENLDTFNNIWNSKWNEYKILDIPEAVEQKLIEVAPDEFKDLVFHHTFFKEDHSILNNKNVNLYDYQEEARDKWLKNDYKGIFVMATGTGKTYTALGCLKKALEVNEKLVTIISVPTKHLLPQWKKSIKNFGISYDKLLYATGDTKWRQELEENLLDIRLNIIKKIIVLVTHDTLSSTDFISLLTKNKKSKYFLIGDEMHGLGSPYHKNGLIDSLYDFRLGLSATPTRYSDEESDFLLNFFGDELFHLSLREAIYEFYNPKTGLSYLTPYNYYPYFLSLNKYELQQYKDITLKLFYCKDERLTKEKQNLLFKRAEIIKDAENKFEVLEKILMDMNNYSGLIIYCSPKQINKVLKILSKYNLIAHRFTMNESTKPLKKFNGMSERDIILNDFSNGNYQVLVAMHCLDEGVDVPSASKAIFMCSSNSSREFIQRIGRVLRRFEGKTHADIYDLIVKPSNNLSDKSLEKFEEMIFQKEKERYQKIGYIAENYDYVLDKLNENL